MDGLTPHLLHDISSTAMSGGVNKGIINNVGLQNNYFFHEKSSKHDSTSSNGPAVWNLTERNPHFKGRAEILESVTKHLQNVSTCAITQVITGLGGIGKTQLAKEFAYLHKENYQLIWWLDASMLEQGYRDLAEAINRHCSNLKLRKTIAIEGHNLSVIRSRTQDILRNSSFRWLIVIDDVENESDIRAFLPQHNNKLGHILITSRNQHWQAFKSLSLSLLPRNDSIALLRSIIENEQSPFTEMQVKNADKLCELLQDLPLALTQAGFYIKESDGLITISEYIALFKTKCKELWQDEQPPNDYQYTVKATFKISMDKIKRKDSQAREMLNIIGYFNQYDIPVKALKDLLSIDDIILTKLLKILRCYSIVDINKLNKSISIHKLLQLTILADIEDEQKRTTLLKQIVDYFIIEFSGDIETNVNSWPYVASLLPHAASVSHHLENGELIKERVDILVRVGKYLHYAQGDYEKAFQLFEEANSISKKISHLKCGRHYILKLMGESLLRQGKSDKALSYLEESLKEYKFEFDDAPIINNIRIGSEHILHDMGRCLMAIGSYDEAKCIQKSIIKSYEYYIVNNLPNADKIILSKAAAQQQLGISLFKLKQYDKALAEFKAALGIFNTLNNGVNPNAADTYQAIGNIDFSLHRFFDSKNDFKKSVDIFTKVYSNNENHPKLFETYIMMSKVYMYRKNYNKANRYIEKSNAILSSLSYSDSNRNTIFEETRDYIKMQNDKDNMKLGQKFLLEPIRKSPLIRILNKICLNKLNIQYPFVGYIQKVKQKNSQSYLTAIMNAPPIILAKAQNFFKQYNIECLVEAKLSLLMIENIDNTPIAEKVKSLEIIANNAYFNANKI